MARFEIDPTGDGEAWEPIDARDASEAARLYTRAHAEEEGWSDSVDVRVRDAAGVVRDVRVSWFVETVVTVRGVKVVSGG